MGLAQEIFEGIAAAKGVRDAFDYSEMNLRNEYYKAAKRENDDWDERRKNREQAIGEKEQSGIGAPAGPPGVQTTAAAGTPGTNNQAPYLPSYPGAWTMPPLSRRGGLFGGTPPFNPGARRYAEGGVVEDAQAFDPQGTGYDHRTARLADMKRDTSGHMQSRDPVTGMQLKGRRHPTFDTAVEEDRKLGYGLEMENGRYYTRPFKKGYRAGGMVREEETLEPPDENIHREFDSEQDAPAGPHRNAVPDPGERYQEPSRGNDSAFDTSAPMGFADGGLVDDDDSEAELVVKSIMNRDIGMPDDTAGPVTERSPALGPDRAARTIDQNTQDPWIPPGPLSEWQREGSNQRVRDDESTRGAQARDAEAMQTSAPTTQPRSRFERTMGAIHDFVSPPGSVGEYEHGQRQRERIRQATPPMHAAMEDTELAQRERQMQEAYTDVANERNTAIDTGVSEFADAARKRAEGAVALRRDPTKADAQPPAQGDAQVPMRNMPPRGEVQRDQPDLSRAIAASASGPSNYGRAQPPGLPPEERGSPLQTYPAGAPVPGGTTASTRPPNQTPGGIPQGSADPSRSNGNSGPQSGNGSTPAPPQQAMNTGTPQRKALSDQSRTAAYDPTADASDPRNIRPVDVNGRTYTDQDVGDLIGSAVQAARPGPNGTPIIGQGAVRPQTFDAYAQRNSQGGKLSKGEALLVGMLSDYRTLMKQGRIQQASLMAYGLMQAANVEAAVYGQSAMKLLQQGDTQGATQKMIDGVNMFPDGKQHVVNKDGSISVTDPYTGQVLHTGPVTGQQLLAGIMGLQDGTAFWNALQSAASMFQKPDRDAEGRALSNEIKRRQIQVLDKKIAGGGKGGAAGPSAASQSINQRIAALGGGGTQNPTGNTTVIVQGAEDDGSMRDPGMGGTSNNED